MSFLQKHSLLLLLILFGFWFRVSFIQLPAHMDESLMYVRFVTQGLDGIVTDYSNVNNHVLLSLILYFLDFAVGNELILLRLPSLVFGTLLIPASYLLGNYTYNHNAGLVAAVLVATSKGLVNYSVLARGYALMILIVVLAFLLAIQILRHPKPWMWIALATCLVLGFYTLPIMAYPAGVLLVWMGLCVLFRTSNGMRRMMLTRLTGWVGLSAIVVVLLYVPLLYSSQNQESETSYHLIGDNSITSPQGVDSFVEETLKYPARVYRAAVRDYPRVFIFTLWIFALVSLRQHRKINKTPVPLAFAVLLWLVPVYLAMRITPAMRTWLFLIPLFAVEVGGGLTYVFKRWQVERHLPVMLAGLTLLLTMGTYPSMQAEADSLLRKVAGHEKTSEIVSTLNASQTVSVFPRETIFEQCNLFEISVFLYGLQTNDIHYEHTLPSTLTLPQVNSHSDCYVAICDAQCDMQSLDQMTITDQVYYPDLRMNAIYLSLYSTVDAQGVDLDNDHHVEAENLPCLKAIRSGLPPVLWLIRTLCEIEWVQAPESFARPYV